MNQVVSNGDRLQDQSSSYNLPAFLHFCSSCLQNQSQTLPALWPLTQQIKQLSNPSRISTCSKCAAVVVRLRRKHTVCVDARCKRGHQRPQWFRFRVQQLETAPISRLEEKGWDDDDDSSPLETTYSNRGTRDGRGSFVTTCHESHFSLHSFASWFSCICFCLADKLDNFQMFPMLITWELKAVKCLSSM